MGRPKKYATYEERKAAATARQRERRQQKPIEETLARQAKDAESKRKRRQNESSEETLRRQAREAECKRRRRQNESSKETLERQMRNAADHRDRRQNESNEERNIRRAELHRQQRTIESPAIREIPYKVKRAIPLKTTNSGLTHKGCIKCGIQLNDSEKTFFLLPTHDELREKWLNILSIKNCDRQSYVCENHFFSQDIILTTELIENVSHESKSLRPGAFPIKFYRSKPVSTSSLNKSHGPTETDQSVELPIKCEFSSNLEISCDGIANDSMGELSPRCNLLPNLEVSCDETATDPLNITVKCELLSSPDDTTSTVPIKCEWLSSSDEYSSTIPVKCESSSDGYPMLMPIKCELLSSPDNESSTMPVKCELVSSSNDQALRSNISSNSELTYNITIPYNEYPLSSTFIDMAPNKKKPWSSNYYQEVVAVVDDITLPSPNWNWIHDKETQRVFFFSYTVNVSSAMLREIFVTTSDIKIRIYGRYITLLTYPRSIHDFITLIAYADNINACSGYPLYDHFKNRRFYFAERDYGVMRHKKCKFFLPLGKMCAMCSQLDKVDQSPKKGQRKKRVKMINRFVQKDIFKIS